MKAAVGIPEERLLTQHPNGWPLILDARCLTVTPQVLTGAYEPEVYAFVSSCIRPGDHVLEIGCNVGLYTIRMAELTGPSGRIVGFEPNPVSHRILRDNMIACGLRNRVEIHQKAVGERDATV